MTQKMLVTVCVTLVILAAIICETPLDQLGRYLLMLVGLGG